jgi:hypothetical protein
LQALPPCLPQAGKGGQRTKDRNTPLSTRQSLTSLNLSTAGRDVDLSIDIMSFFNANEFLECMLLLWYNVGIKIYYIIYEI